MAAVKRKLSHHERWIVENAHSESEELHRHASALLQIRLDSITAAHNIPDGTEVTFVKEGDSLVLQFDDGATPLRLFDDRNHGADATVADEDDGC